jgi:hypothetical protein
LPAISIPQSVGIAASRLEAENAALRQQVTVLQRNSRGRVALTNGHRMFFVFDGGGGSIHAALFTAAVASTVALMVW